ncbi:MULTISPECIES: histidine phosphatase family protein [unclassified Oceanispirochaeta]|uniref:SixA phosphatase family protein n=1 Tax=unclassified Oceanispirochaeta TaxID=2635722 RepID=UPI000E09980B|nr:MULTISPECIES: histidine phosphatase family protein [unclassified Oceanispirochaeta]MBF9014687.1 histidine phosphatase family protein [Oceanispirochaeta sp. M2]NPD70943.1 phosphohistidine phosphatase [Oceanispirochaeta sp. M1]RDG33777.1 phosphohistidine phosphatase [Oceanispirochaeta sp. M1]
MKLVLIRHGKSDWHAGKDDFDRPLNKRGIKDAPIIARELKARGIIPDKIFTSPALRALTTAQLMADQFEITDIEEKSSLYLASVNDILQTAYGALGKYDCVFIFGHNPGMSIAATTIRDIETSMSTCSAAVISFEKDDDFTVIDSFFLKPKDL